MSLSAQEKITIEYFTTIEKVYNIELGMNPEKVNSTLGIDPFDVYQNLDMGELVLEYRYKHKKIRNNADKIFYKSNMNDGEVYYDDPSSLFMIFDSERSLTSYYTDSGKQNAKDAYMWEQTMLLHNKNVDCKDCRVVIPPVSNIDLVQLPVRVLPTKKRRKKAAKEKAAKEKVTKEKVTKEKAAKEKVTKEKVTKEKAAKEKAAKEKAAKEKVTKEKVTKEKVTNNSASIELQKLQVRERELNNQIPLEKDLREKGKLARELSRVKANIRNVEKEVAKKEKEEKKVAKKKEKEEKKAAKKKEKEEKKAAKKKEKEEKKAAKKK